MDQNVHVFILRIWHEPREVEHAAPVWRGVIEHVASGERRYLKDLGEAIEFMIPYIKQMDVQLKFVASERTWLERLVALLTRKPS